MQKLTCLVLALIFAASGAFANTPPSPHRFFVQKASPKGHIIQYFGDSLAAQNTYQPTPAPAGAAAPAW
jgi:hypothetical protein